MYGFFGSFGPFGQFIPASGFSTGSPWGAPASPWAGWMAGAGWMNGWNPWIANAGAGMGYGWSPGASVWNPLGWMTPWSAMGGSPYSMMQAPMPYGFTSQNQTMTGLGQPGFVPPAFGGPAMAAPTPPWSWQGSWQTDSGGTPVGGSHGLFGTNQFHGAPANGSEARGNTTGGQGMGMPTMGFHATGFGGNGFGGNGFGGNGFGAGNGTPLSSDANVPVNPFASNPFDDHVEGRRTPSRHGV